MFSVHGAFWACVLTAIDGVRRSDQRASWLVENIYFLFTKIGYIDTGLSDPEIETINSFVCVLAGICNFDKPERCCVFVRSPPPPFLQLAHVQMYNDDINV